MKTLELILKSYISGQISLQEMKEIIDETMTFLGYQMVNGKREIKVIHGERIIRFSI